MSEQKIIDRLNAIAPRFIELLGGSVVAVDIEARTLAFEFNVCADYCHSGDIVQGGFITAMLDAAMAHSLFAQDTEIVNVASLDVNTSYLEVTRAGKLRAEAHIIKSTYKTAFLESQLYDDNGTKTAIASSVAKLIRARAGDKP